jgi:uncharacterized membrane protein (DUF373 family)
MSVGSFFTKHPIIFRYIGLILQLKASLNESRTSLTSVVKTAIISVLKEALMRVALGLCSGKSEASVLVGCGPLPRGNIYGHFDP